jgi:hypothetical protein
MAPQKEQNNENVCEDTFEISKYSHAVKLLQ